MISDRNKIRAALKDQALGVAAICRKTGLSPKAVSTHLSSMKINTKEVIYNKVPGEYGTYRLKEKTNSQVILSIDLKLSQLRSHREECRIKGLSLIDDIISDYEILQTYFGRQK